MSYCDSLYADRKVPAERGNLLIQKVVGMISGVKPLMVRGLKN